MSRIDTDRGRVAAAAAIVHAQPGDEGTGRSVEMRGLAGADGRSPVAEIPFEGQRVAIRVTALISAEGDRERDRAIRRRRVSDRCRGAVGGADEGDAAHLAAVGKSGVIKRLGALVRAEDEGDGAAPAEIGGERGCGSGWRQGKDPATDIIAEEIRPFELGRPDAGRDERAAGDGGNSRRK